MLSIMSRVHLCGDMGMGHGDIRPQHRQPGAPDRLEEKYRHASGHLLPIDVGNHSQRPVDLAF